MGASMACALANSGWKVTIIEALPISLKSSQDFDTRSIAINYHSRNLFEALDLWQTIGSSSQAIEHIHVSDQGHLGMVRLHAKRFFPHPFGYVCEHQKILEALYEKISQSNNINMINPAHVISLTHDAARVKLKIQIAKSEGPETLTASLVIAADGGNSALKRMLGVDDNLHDHQQTAFAANLQMQMDKPGWAFERFTAQGPLALLPLGQGRYSLIYTCHSQDQEKVKALAEADFIHLLQKNFGYRLGRIEKLGKVTSFPLRRSKSVKEYSGRVIFIGNASHTLHPIAGQGFNLGLRDIWELSQLLKSCQRSELANTNFCERYANARKKDHLILVNATDALARLYSNHHLIPVVSRNFLASGMNYFPMLQSPLVSQASGL